MQWIDDSKSQYGRRFVCSGKDIDEVMEEHYLKFHKGNHNFDQSAFDIERFIEECLRKEEIEYEPEAIDLSVGVLGETRFNPDGSRLIRISAKLYRQRHLPAARARFRFTCAHEAFHAMFHGPLFARGGRIVCLGRHIREDFVEPRNETVDFIEWQANRGAAALLMPQSIFTECVKRERKTNRRSGGIDLLIDNLSARFDVSKQSVKIRLQSLGLWAQPEDEQLLEHDGIDSYQDIRSR